MSQTAALQRIADLLKKIEDVYPELATNEADLYRDLRAQFYNQETPYQPGFEDEVCLKTILRNIDVRKKLRQH